MYRSQEPPPLPTAPAQKSNSLALFSLIAGILSVGLGFLSLCIPCLCAFPLILGIISAVLGFLGKKKIDESGVPDSSRKMAVAGMILGIVGVGFSVVAAVISLIGFAPFGIIALPFQILEGF